MTCCSAIHFNVSFVLLIAVPSSSLLLPLGVPSDTHLAICDSVVGRSAMDSSQTSCVLVVVLPSCNVHVNHSHHLLCYFRVFVVFNIV